MAKKSIQTPANSVAWNDLPALSFDASSGGFGHWYPRPLSASEVHDATHENGRRHDSETTAYAIGCTVGRKAADEYIERIRIQKSNFWQDEDGADLSRIVLAMMEPCDSSPRRRGEVIAFFQHLYPYLAFGARNVTESDKTEHAKR